MICLCLCAVIDRCAICVPWQVLQRYFAGSLARAKWGLGDVANLFTSKTTTKACFPSSQPQSRKNKIMKTFPGAIQRGKNLVFLKNRMLGNQPDWRLFYFRSPAGFVQIFGSTLQVQTQLWAMQERLLPFVGAIPASRYMGMSRALTVICAFPPCLSLLPSMSCLLNLLHNKYFHFFPWRVKRAHRKICLSPCITTKSAHQAQIRVYFPLPSDRWWCVKETGVNPQGWESISRMF